MNSRPLVCCWLLPLLGVFVGQPARACMNDYRPNTVAMERSQNLRNQLTQHLVKEPWTARRDRLRKLLAAGGDFQVKNDLATTLAHTGEAGEAVKLLEQIEAEKPGLYFTAANLGTAYELSGDDRKALEWIRKGIERNPQAHNGTEWLHVRILEAELALAKDPKWLETHSILGGPAHGGAMGTQSTGNRGELLTIEQVKAALLYQLHERMQFVAPPNTVVGALLLDLGDLVAHEPLGPGGAFDLYALGNGYFEALPESNPLKRRLLERLREAEEKQRHADVPAPGNILFGMLMVVVVGLVTLFVMRLITARRLEQEVTPLNRERLS